MFYVVNFLTFGHQYNIWKLFPLNYWVIIQKNTKMKINYQLFFLIISIAFFGNLQPVKGQASTSKKTEVNKTTASSKVKWTAKAFDYSVFIENQGQFEGPQDGGKILYGAKVGDVYAFIT